LRRRESGEGEWALGDIYRRLTGEMRLYAGYIEGYQGRQRSFYESTYFMMRQQLTDFFGKDVEVQRSGSYVTNLYAPFSDVNLVASFRNKFMRDEELYRRAAAFKFYLEKQRELFEGVSFDERKGNVIMKIRLSRSPKTVEVIFRLFMNKPIPKNEQIMQEFLALYPLSKPLYLAVRTLFHQAEMDNPALFGINSLAIYLMIIAFL
jgi:DNA polymerase sigma